MSRLNPAPVYRLSGKKIALAGHTGLVGSALARVFDADPDLSWVGASSAECDFRQALDTHRWIDHHRPAILVIAAARVGGIKDNQDHPVDYLDDNLLIARNLLRAAHECRVERVLFLGSSCIYPRACPQPIREDYLMTGPLEGTNSAYAIAKIAALRLVQAYREQYGHRWITIMPCNLYGPFDRFDAARSHVLPALMLKMHRAKQTGAKNIMVGGDGTPLREFLHADDLARACRMLIEQYDDDLPINAGSGDEISIRDLAVVIRTAIGWDGDLVFDPTYPNGTPRKILDSSRLRALGWTPQIPLEEGIVGTYRWYCAHHD